MNFRRYWAFDNAAIRKFYFLFGLPLFGARRVGLLKMVVNKQSLTTIIRGGCRQQTRISGPWIGPTGFKAQLSFPVKSSWSRSGRTPLI
jgi:hypothetical protein